MNISKIELMEGLLIMLFALILIVIMVLFYFLPSIIAFNAKRKNALAIFVLNLFLGWTFIGWVGALIWALVK